MNAQNERERAAVPERRASSLSPEEVQQGIEFRKKALKSPDVDLGSIARTAPALSTSPKQPTTIVTDAQVCCPPLINGMTMTGSDCLIVADQRRPRRLTYCLYDNAHIIIVQAGLSSIM